MSSGEGNRGNRSVSSQQPLLWCLHVPTPLYPTHFSVPPSSRVRARGRRGDIGSSLKFPLEQEEEKEDPLKVDPPEEGS